MSFLFLKSVALESIIHRQSKIARGLYDAESKGYRACSYCKGTPFATIEVVYYKIEEIDISDEIAVKSLLFASFCTVVFMPIVNHLKRVSGA